MSDAVARTSTPDAGSGNPIDISTVTTSVGTVDRQRMCVADPILASGIMAVKLGSTAAVAADPSAVVALSPNSPLPAGGNAIGTVVINPSASAAANTITSASSVITLSVDQTRPFAVITVNGTYSGVSFVVEYSDDGSTWYPLMVTDRNTGSVLSTVTPGTNVSASYNVVLGAPYRMRVRATAWTSGTATIAINTTSSSIAPTVSIMDGTGGTGRQYVCIILDRLTGITTEALATMGINKGGITSSGTSYTVTSGTTLRLQSITFTLEATSTTGIFGRLRLRSAASAISMASPIILSLDQGIPSTGTIAAGDGETTSLTFPDGLEIAGTQQIAISHIVNNASSTISASLVGYEY